MADAPKTAAQEWRAFGPLVMAATFGLSFGAMPNSTLGLLMDPLNAEFGWSRSKMALGMTIFALITTPPTPSPPVQPPDSEPVASRPAQT